MADGIDQAAEILRISLRNPLTSTYLSYSRIVESLKSSAIVKSQNILLSEL